MDTGISAAPGHPGISPKWTSSSKTGIGKSLNASSQVTFTISHGILNEIYFPREDIACVRDMGLLVSDGHNFFSEEKRHADHAIRMMEDGVPAYELVNTCREKKYRITKEIIADPLRNTVLQKIRFETDEKNTYKLYALLAPHLDNEGEHNSGWVGHYKGHPMLFARNGDLTLAFACSGGWLRRSAGFVGASDGWTDIHLHKAMLWEYSSAADGNIALTGEIDLSQGNEVVLAMGFGRNTYEAANHAHTSILDGFDNAKKLYMQEWRAWLGTLHNVKGKYYKISAAVLRIHEAQTFQGGIIASLSIPWGETKGDPDKGGYHMVWPRDLVESAGGFIALKTKDDALRIVNYLMSTQKADGSWPQNMWLSGNAYWKGIQLDQTALPILLIDQCARNNAIDKDRMQRYWPVIKKAISFLILNGPYTQQDRWEEEKGYSPFTLASEITGLLSAAELAEANGEKALAAYCRETADYWNDQIETWTYVTGTELAKEVGVEGYYIRINPCYNIAAKDLGGTCIYLKNHEGEKGKTLLSELVSADALALVRFGLRAADNPKILDTLKVIDAKLKVETAKGTSWHRYTNDGYGETNDGEAYSGAGVGRAWPLLTGERAHYEIAAGNMKGAKKLLAAMEAFANNGLIPEQVWDSDDLPERGLFSGSHSGSAMPLTWAHAEYIKLCASIKDKKIFDMPPQTYGRYIAQKTISPFAVWTFSNAPAVIPSSKILRVELRTPATVRWTDDNWATAKQVDTTDTGIGTWFADLHPAKENSTSLEFTFFWQEARSWEEKNYRVERKEN